MIKWFDEYDEPEVVRRNFMCNVLDGALYAFAASVTSLSVVIPVFVKKVGESNIAIGLIPVVWTIGFNFPQIFIANYSSRHPLKKPLLLKTSLGQRLPWLLIAILSYLVMDKVSNEVGLLIFFACYMMAAVAGSLNLPGWFDLVAKLTPIKLRGRLFASRTVLGAILGIIGGWIVKQVLEAYSYPDNFALLFLIAFVMTMASYVFINLLKENKPDPPGPVLTYKEFLRRLPGILKKERNFRNFLVADALLIMALMADVFYSVNALEKFSLPDGYIGDFTIIIMTCSILGNFFFGYMADHFGHKLNLLLAAGSTAAACTAAMLSPTIELYFIAFAGSAFTSGFIQLSRLPIIAELCAAEERQTFIALTNMISAPFSLAGLLGGWVANRFGYNMVFTIAGLLALSSAVWFMLMVKEPRNTLIAQPAEEN